MPRSNESSPRRRLRTPSHRESERNADSSRRSRSRTRREGDTCRSRSGLRTPDRRKGRDSDRELEQEMEHHRERLRALEGEWSRERSLRRRATPLAGAERNNRRVSKDDELERLRVRDRSLPRERSPTVRRSREVRDGADITSPTPRNTRSDSPTFTSRDIMNIINSINNVKSQSQPLTVASPSSNNNMNHKNILPNFDPSSKGQRIDIWLKKVNECATVYGWDETTIIHFAMQKLQGLAKTWYESLNSILFSWSEWQHKLTSAFPFEQNYGQSLEYMLRRKSKIN